jgi:hypothetical protein
MAPCVLASLNCSTEAPSVPRQDDEENHDWVDCGRGGMDWAGLQPFYVDETDDLESILHSIDEPLKPSLS